MASISRYALFFALTLVCVSSYAARQEVSQPPKATLDADGNMHVPATTVPPSSLESEEAKAQFTRFVGAYDALWNWAESAPDINSLRKDLDDHLLRPGVAELRKVFPVTITPQVIGGVQTDVVEPVGGVSPRESNRVLIELHGGGFTLGARWGGQMESIPIASLGGIKVITVDYREAPEYKFPAASEDVAAVYQALLKQYKARNIGIYGCSAGGMLTAESVAWFEKQRLPPPGAIGIFGAGALVPAQADSSAIGPLLMGWPLVPLDVKKPFPYFDVPKFNAKAPLVSPAYWPSVLAHFPPTLLISGTRDAYLSEAAYTQAQLVKAGIVADLHVWEGAPHCSFAQPVVDPNVPENREAWNVIVSFFDSHLGRTH